MSFINNHPILARFAALPVALTEGLKTSLIFPVNSLALGVKAIGLAIFVISPRDVPNDYELPRFPLSFSLGISSIGLMAFSPLLSPVLGAATATQVFLKIMTDPANFGK